MAVLCPKWGFRYSHVELTALTEAEVSNDTLLASATIGKLLGAEPKYMRPPFGRFRSATRRTAPVTVP